MKMHASREPVDYVDGSGWVDRPTDVTGRLSSDLTCDVVVVGGGLGGMSATLRLAELGHDVALLESDVCGWGASARNAGYVTATLGSDPRILSRFYADRERGMYRFANNSVRYVERLVSQPEMECDYRPTGIFNTSTSARSFAKLRATTPNGRRTTVSSAVEAGVPDTFYGGVHIKVGGTLNPGRLALNLRERALASPARVFENTRVLAIEDDGSSVRVRTAGGTIRSGQVLLTANAFMNTIDVAPRNLSTPVYVTAIETEPLTDAQLDATGWTSRLPLLTSHLIMESYRTTPRNTIVVSTRKIETAQQADPNRLPRPSVVEDLVRAFRSRFPSLEAVMVARTWGGWIGMTPSNFAVAGNASPRVLYSLACNGHGLPQAPYLGELVADHMGGLAMHEDLEAMWRTKPDFAPGIVNAASVRLGWLADRFTDRWAHVRR